jgi:redox-sensitive bicupin YhaK (pirin superfamily)
MIEIRRAEDRGRTEWGWLDSRHTFSFGEYHDGEHEGFRSLRVLNDDRVQPGQGFGTHGHRDMEILSYVLDGALEHKDNAGGGGVIRPGEIQFMRAGSGVMHSEFNHSKIAPVHFLHIWIIPDTRGLPPAYGQQSIDREKAKHSFVLLASKDGRDGSLHLQRDANVWMALVNEGEQRDLPLGTGRYAWVHVARGSASVNGSPLREGDGAGVSGEDALHFRGHGSAEILVFDLG